MVFTGGDPRGIYRQRPGFPLLPQYLEPLGRDLYLYRDGAAGAFFISSDTIILLMISPLVSAGLTPRYAGYNALPVIGISPFWQMAISGAVIVMAVLLNERGNRVFHLFRYHHLAHDFTPCFCRANAALRRINRP
jgi:hypothetical protein